MSRPSASPPRAGVSQAPLTHRLRYRAPKGHDAGRMSQVAVTSLASLSEAREEGGSAAAAPDKALGVGQRRPEPGFPGGTRKYSKSGAPAFDEVEHARERAPPGMKAVRAFAGKTDRQITRSVTGGNALHSST